MSCLPLPVRALLHAREGGYQRSEAPRRPTLDGFVGVIDEILRTDKALIKKQRHTAKRIFERLRPSHRNCVSTAGQWTNMDMLVA